MNEDAVIMWIQRAEDDFEAGRLLMQSERPITWVVCFHMQQCVEKYLKAFLIFHAQEHPRIHNISALVNLCAQIDNSFHELKEWGIRDLTKYAIALRYGDDPYTPDQQETLQAVDLAERVRAFVRAKLAHKGLQL